MQGLEVEPGLFGDVAKGIDGGDRKMEVLGGEG